MLAKLEQLNKIMALSQIRFCKKFLGDSFFRDAVDTEIHEEKKNESTTNLQQKLGLRDSTIILLCVVTMVFSCAKKPLRINTEVICPDGTATLVTSARAEDVADAIQIAYQKKKILRTSENYTPIRLRDGRSLALKNLSPENAVLCALHESKAGDVESSYVHSFTK